jgi:hypothetical protein
MHRLRSLLSALKPTRLGVLFAVLVGLGVGFWQWNRPLQPRVVLEDMGRRSFRLPGPYFSPDGRIVAIFHKDPGDLHFFSLTLWDAQTGERKLDLFSPPVSRAGETATGITCPDGVIFSLDGKKIAGIFQEQINSLEDVPRAKIHVWEVASGKKLATFEEKDPSAKLGFSPEGKLFALRDKFSLWDVADDKEIKQLVLREGDEIVGSRDNLVLVRSQDDVLKVWDLSTGTLVAKRPDILPHWKGDKHFWRWMSNRLFVVVLFRTGKAFIFDLFTEEKKEFAIDEQRFTFALNTDGKTIAVDYFICPLPEEWWEKLMSDLGIRDIPSTHQVTLKAIPSGEQIAVLNRCMYPHFSKDGSTLIVNGEDGSLQLWDLPIRKPIGKILGLAALAAVATLLAFNGLGWLRRRRGSPATAAGVAASSGQIASSG